MFIVTRPWCLDKFVEWWAKWYVKIAIQITVITVLARIFFILKFKFLSYIIQHFSPMGYNYIDTAHGDSVKKANEILTNEMKA